MPHQQGNVFTAVGQWRQKQPDDIQPVEQFFAGSAGPLYQDGAAAGGDVGQDVQDAQNRMAFADNVLETVAAVDFLAQGFHGGQIPENFDAANDIAGVVFQHRGADTGGYGMAIAVEDIDVQVDGLPAVLHGFAQGAICLADIRAKYIEAFTAQGLIAGYPLVELS